MELLGLGNDIVEISRIRKTLATYGERWVRRCFTPKEQAYCMQYHDAVPHYAARFSAKESVVKALGSGFRQGISWTDIEILNNQQGKPEVGFSPKLQLLFHHPIVWISMSHSVEYVSTVAIWVGKSP